MPTAVAALAETLTEACALEIVAVYRKALRSEVSEAPN
jgi:hypothetical protein